MAIAVIPAPHHITRRGVRRMETFLMHLLCVTLRTLRGKILTILGMAPGVLLESGIDFGTIGVGPG